MYDIYLRQIVCHTIMHLKYSLLEQGSCLFIISDQDITNPTILCSRRLGIFIITITYDN